MAFMNFCFGFPVQQFQENLSYVKKVPPRKTESVNKYVNLHGSIVRSVMWQQRVAMLQNYKAHIQETTKRGLEHF